MTKDDTPSPLEDDWATQSVSLPENVRDHRGSLRSKLVLSLAAMFFVFLTIDEIVRQRVIRPEFAALERTGAIRDAKRVISALQFRVAHLDEVAQNWASSMDYPSPAVDSLPSEQSEQTDADERIPVNVDWAAIVSSNGSWRWLHQLQNKERKAADIDSQKLVDIGKHCDQSQDRSISGLTRVADNSLVIFAAAKMDPMKTSSGNQLESEQQHYLIVGRTVDRAMLASLREQTQVNFSLQSMRTPANHTKKLSVWAADDSTLVVEFQLSGIDNQQLANVFVEVPRDITVRSNDTISMARNSFIFGSVGALLMLLLLLQRIVIGPLTAIREHSDRVAERGFNTEPLVLSGNDEIGELANAFDHMMHRLGDAQTQLTEASRAAGRSQVASTVIHNVGNVLTNINSLLDVASDRVEGLRIEPLSKLANRLREKDGDEELMNATPDYLEGLATSLDADRNTISHLISTLHDNVRHIHGVIRDQQRHTGHCVKPMSVAVSELLHEAIGCCRARLDQDEVIVQVSGSLDVDVHTDRSLLLQSMINVIGNARHALRENVEGPRTLSILAEKHDNSLSLRFVDNGIGMSDETLEKVFDAHFTTKRTGNGLGLHFCAIALKRLGGSIHAESDGLGYGSAFVIELPLASTPSQDALLEAVGSEA